MTTLREIQDNYLKYFDKIFYLTILSIFIVDIKLYIPMFILNIMMVFTMIYTKDIKLKFSAYEVLALFFIGWSIINTFISAIIFKNELSFSTIIKLNINIAYFLSMSMLFNQKNIRFTKSDFINLLEFIIIINFIQIIVVYFYGGLFKPLLNGTLTKSSSTAYAVNAYHTVIGAENKNIWGSKFAFIVISYLYMSISDKISIKKSRVIIYLTLAVSTVVLLLSRTVQIAIIIPIIGIFFIWINKSNFKYKKIIYILGGIIAFVILIIFFNKLFHINFNDQDGGYSRLQMWISAGREIWNTHWLVGNGIGQSGYYIKTALGMPESNLHNVYLNLFFELGIIGCITYVLMIISYLKSMISENKKMRLAIIVAIPFIIITMLQYLGFDNDIIILLLIIMSIKTIKLEE